MSVAIEPSLSRAIQEYSQAWVESLRQVLDKIQGDAFTIQTPFPEAGDPSSQPEAGIWLRFSANQRLAGEQALFVSKSDALALAAVLMSEPPDPGAELDELHADAAVEVLRMASGTAATSLSSKLGGEVELASQVGDRPQWTPAAHVAMRCASAQTPPIGVHLFLSPELAAALEPRAEESREERTAPSQVAPSQVAPRQQRPAGASARRDKHQDSSVGFLREVELEVYLRLGERQLLLRDILALGRGGVVELDKQLQDPVDLLVGQKVVARGELVIVDGNYGLRVTEIAPQQERLESLRR